MMNLTIHAASQDQKSRSNSTRRGLTLRFLRILLISGIFPILLSSTSYRTECVVPKLKPIRHLCGIAVDDRGEPISNASVTLLKGGTQLEYVLTGADGRFSLGRLQAGTYAILARASGYKPAESSIVIVRPTAKCKHGLRIVLGPLCSAILPK